MGQDPKNKQQLTDEEMEGVVGGLRKRSVSSQPQSVDDGTTLELRGTTKEGEAPDDSPQAMAL